MLKRIVARAFRPEPDVPDPKLVYALNEISELRQIVRTLVADRQSNRSADQTLDSFDYQWDKLSDGINMLSDPAFRAKCRDDVMRLTQLDPGWFHGKRVLDAGCGNGRWSAALCALGADVTAIDASEAGVRAALHACSQYPTFTARRHNVLEKLPFGDFDLVWCFGVAHHTGNTYCALRHVADAVKPGGFLFAMIYGEPTEDPHFLELNNYAAKRREIAALTFDDRARVLGEKWGRDHVNAWFDGLSPEINDLHRFDEIEGWLASFGFEQPTRTTINRNHHFIARKPMP